MRGRRRNIAQLFASCSLLALMSCGLCGDQLRESVPSPGGKYSAIVYWRDCGATTRVATHVKLHRNNWWGSEDIIWTTVDEHALLLTWHDDSHLKLDCPSCSPKDVYIAKQRFHDVNIAFAAGSALH